MTQLPGLQLSGRAVELLERVRRSASLFQQLVWPQVSTVFGPGCLAQVEALDAECARTLDLMGIDYLFLPRSDEAFGLASRIQQVSRSGRPWDSFTMSTGQYERLHEAETASFGRILPAVVVQAFVDAGPRLISVGIAKVQDLMSTTPTSTPTGPNGPFCSWSFDELRRNGRLIARLPDPGLAYPFRTDFPKRG